MTILDAIKLANSEAGIANLSFADIQEFNSIQTDAFTYEDWPRNVIVPYSIRGVFTGIRAAETILLIGYVLRRIPEDTNDVRSIDSEPLYISPMRELARKFIRRLLDTEIIDTEREDVTYTIDPEIRFLNSHLFGVRYTAQIPVMKNVC